MPILFAGNRATDFEISTNTVSTTNVLHKNPNFTEAIFMNTPGCVLRSRLKAPATNHLWTSFSMFMQSSGTGYTNSLWFGIYTAWPLGLNAPLSVHWARGFITLRVNGSIVATFGAVAAAQELARYDVHVKLHATTGVFELYRDGVMLLQWTGDTLQGLTHFDSISLFGGGSLDASDNIAFSAFIVSTADSRLLQIAPMYLTGNGAIQEWDGDYTDINDVLHDASDFIETNILNEEVTYTFSKPTTPVGYNIGAIAISGNLNHYGEDVDGVEAIYYDGVDVVSMGAFPHVEVLFAGTQVISEINPATGVRYTDAELAAFEFGFKAV